MTSVPKIGVALGGGGVKGLAHVPLLKLLDRLSLKPCAIAGTSIGAIVGALYAYGLSGEDIEQRILAHTLSKGGLSKEIFSKRKALSKWFRVFSFSKDKAAWLSADGIFTQLFPELQEITFDTLATPLSVVATDFHNGEEVLLNQGNVLEAVRASMAVPGIFAPVRKNAKLLVDGGLVNNLPTKHLYPHAEFIIASDVISLVNEPLLRPNHMISGALALMLSQSTNHNLKAYPAHILVRPNTSNIDAFDLHKIHEARLRGEAEMPALEKRLREQFDLD